MRPNGTAINAHGVIPGGCSLTVKFWGGELLFCANCVGCGVYVGIIVYVG